MVSYSLVCLPDAIQLLTPCTIGNGFLQLLDWGKFALTAYNRMRLTGVRVGLDLDRIGSYPSIREWFERATQRNAKPPFEAFKAAVLAARADLIIRRPVRMKQALKVDQRVPTGPCAGCNEAFVLRLGDR